MPDCPECKAPFGPGHRENCGSNLLDTATARRCAFAVCGACAKGLPAVWNPHSGRHVHKSDVVHGLAVTCQAAGIWALLRDASGLVPTAGPGVPEVSDPHQSVKGLGDSV